MWIKELINNLWGAGVTEWRKQGWTEKGKKHGIEGKEIAICYFKVKAFFANLTVMFLILMAFLILTAGARALILANDTTSSLPVIFLITESTAAAPTSLAGLWGD